MGRQDLEGLLKITERAVSMAVVWRKVFVASGQSFKRPELLASVNAHVADMSEFRIDLKRMLKGDINSPSNEVLADLLKQIDNAHDPDTRKLYINQLLDITERLLKDGRLEVRDVGSK